jgi:hypothetical protein
VKSLQVDSFDDCIDIAENDRFIAVGMPHKNQIVIYKSYPAWDQFFTIKNLETKPYVLEIGPLIDGSNTNENNIIQESHLLAVGDKFLGMVTIFHVQVHLYSADSVNNQIVSLCTIKEKDLLNMENNEGSGFGEAFHVTKSSVYISAHGIGAAFIVNIQNSNKCLSPKLLFQHIPKSMTIFPGQYLAFSKETNRILFGVANAINTNTGPDGRIYYYTSCNDLNYGNTKIKV